MEKIDKILIKEINSKRNHSKSFVRFVEDRNKDSEMYNDYLKEVYVRRNEMVDTFNPINYVAHLVLLALVISIIAGILIVPGNLYNLPYGEMVIGYCSFVVINFFFVCSLQIGIYVAFLC